MSRFANVAVPPTALTVVVPKRVPAGKPGLLLIDSVIESVAPGTMIPFESATETLTPCGPLIVEPAVVLAGWLVKTSFVAAPAAWMLNGLLATFGFARPRPWAVST